VQLAWSLGPTWFSQHVHGHTREKQEIKQVYKGKVHLTSLCAARPHIITLASVVANSDYTDGLIETNTSRFLPGQQTNLAQSLIQANGLVWRGVRLTKSEVIRIQQ
jgi:hypothetical protein